MSRRPHWAVECVDQDEAQTLLQSAPDGSHIEVVKKCAGELVILWVPVPNDLIEAVISPWRQQHAA